MLWSIIRFIKVFIQNLIWNFFLFQHGCPIGLSKTSWTMDIKDLKIVLKHIKRKLNNELIILELGSGVSSLIISSFLKKYQKNGMLISIEGNKNYFDKLEKFILKYKLSSILCLYYIDYFNYGSFIWFNKESILKILKMFDKKIDIIIIDAPPGSLCNNSRAPAIPFLLEFLNDKGVVFLHDTNREDEANIINHWSCFFSNIERYNTKCGLTKFEK